MAARSWKALSGIHFSDFPRAFGFMMSVALVAESINHHPDWFNHYSIVKVWLTRTKSAKSPSLDIELAKKMDSLFLPDRIP